MRNSKVPPVEGMVYRPDIDGLRAVAIVPVVLFHAGIAPFAGGFVGVDVFFVISGYLIASFILTGIQSGKFSLWNFYLRRIRRIFPALFTMMAASAAIGALLLTPHAYRRLGESIVATSLFSSNILFWLQSGYFATPLEQRPLLHTWSLGVEEQFYLIFPLLLMVLCRFFPARLIGVTLTLCLISFGVNVLTVNSHPSFAFFLAPSRIWELFTGVLLCSRRAGAAAQQRMERGSRIPRRRADRLRNLWILAIHAVSGLRGARADRWNRSHHLGWNGRKGNNNTPSLASRAGSRGEDFVLTLSLAFPAARFCRLHVHRRYESSPASRYYCGFHGPRLCLVVVH